MNTKQKRVERFCEYLVQQKALLATEDSAVYTRSVHQTLGDLETKLRDPLRQTQEDVSSLEAFHSRFLE